MMSIILKFYVLCAFSSAIINVFLIWSSLIIDRVLLVSCAHQTAKSVVMIPVFLFACFQDQKQQLLSQLAVVSNISQKDLQNAVSAATLGMDNFRNIL